MNLDAFAAAARGTSTWNDDRAARVLAKTLCVNDERIARRRMTRRAMALGVGAAAVVLFLFHGTPPAPPVDATAAIAQLDDGDGGYGRD